VSEDSPHMGIFYSVHNLGVQRWKWEIKPPDCIKGLRAESGVVEGHRLDAVVAARKAIEFQTAQFQRRVDVGEFLDMAEALGFDPSEVISAFRKMP
jgi:hypothetical protein